MTTALPAEATTAQVLAPAHWEVVEFVSDLHLGRHDRATAACWQAYVAQCTADAVFILGDLFEVWVGDDVLDLQRTGVPNDLALWSDAQWDTPGWFERWCVQQLQQLGQQRPVYFMHGNRDFLAGAQLMAESGMVAMSDPCRLDIFGQTWLLSHGDALCVGDTAYMQWRQQVRQTDWMAATLARPLAQRLAMATHIRQEKMATDRSALLAVDIDFALARTWLIEHQAQVLLHGHTHKPGIDVLEPIASPAGALPLRRIVLSDWDSQAQPARAQALRLTAGQWQRKTVGGNSPPAN